MPAASAPVNSPAQRAGHTILPVFTTDDHRARPYRLDPGVVRWRRLRCSPQTITVYSPIRVSVSNPWTALLREAAHARVRDRRSISQASGFRSDARPPAPRTYSESHPASFRRVAFATPCRTRAAALPIHRCSHGPGKEYVIVKPKSLLENRPRFQTENELRVWRGKCYLKRYDMLSGDLTNATLRHDGAASGHKSPPETAKRRRLQTERPEVGY